MATAIDHEVDESIEALEAIRAFFETLPDLGRSRFRLLAERAFVRNPSLTAIEWAPRVRAAERPAFQAAARREGLPGFQVTERTGPGTMVPAGSRPEHVPVLFVEPLPGNEPVLGFDLASEAARREALQRARDSGKPAATSRIRLIQERGDQAGMLILMPVYRGNSLTTVAERREGLRGYVLVVFRVSDLVDSALKRLSLTDIALFLEDASAPPGQGLLLSRVPERAGPEALASGGEQRPGRAGLHAQRPLDVAGRRWVLDVLPTSEYLAAQRSSHEWTMLVAGLLATALLGAYLFTSANRSARLAAINEALEREVADRRRAEEAAERQWREAETVAELARTINASLDLATVLQRVTETARDLCGSDAARLALRDPETGKVPYHYSAGDDDLAFPTMVVEPGMGIGGLALSTGRPVRTDSYGEDPRAAGYVAAGRAEGLVAVLAVPILAGGQVEGILIVDNRAPRPFTDREEAMLCRLADHAAVAVQNARLYAEARSRLRQTETLLAVAQAVGGTLDLTEVARRTVRELVRILDADIGGAWLLAPGGEEYLPLAGYRVPPDLLEAFARGSIPADHPMVRSLRESEGPIYLSDGRADPRVDHPLWERLPYKAVVVCSVRAKEQIVGGLAVAWVREAHVVTAEARRLLDAVVRQAAVAIEHARLVEAERRLEARKDALVGLSRELATERDLDRLLSRVAREARELMGTDTALLLLRAGDRLELRGIAGAEDGLLATGSLKTDGSLTGIVVREGRPSVCPDLAEDPGWRQTAVVQRFGYRAMVAVPLVIQEDVVGVLQVLHRAPRQFPPDEVEFLGALASHAALAIQNAQFLAEADRRRRSAESLAEVGRLISESLDPEEVGRRVVVSVRALLGASTSMLYRLDEESGDLVAIVAPDDAPPSMGRGLVFPRGTGAVGLAVLRTALVVTANVLDDPEIALTPELRARIEQATCHRAVLAVPLVAQGRVIGALGIGDGSGRVFDEGEIRLAQAFADQAAIALENARVFAEAERRRREAEELARVAQALTETTDVAQVGERIAETVLPLFRVRSAILRLLEPNGSLRVIASSGSAREQFPPGHVLPPGVGLMGRVIAEGQPSWSADLLGMPGLVRTEDYARRAADSGAGSALAVPLRVKGRIVGTLGVLDRPGRAFSEADAALLQTFADQAAIALENARLLEEVQARHARLEDLLNVARELSRIQPVATLLDSIAQACGRLLDTDSVGVRLVEGDELVMTGAWGTAAEVMTTPRIKIGQSLTGVVAATGEPLLVMDPADDPRLIVAHREAIRRLGYRCWLGVPIKAGERVLGVMSLRTERPEGFSQGDMAVATAFASQAAVTLENARLYQEAQRAYDELSRTQHQLTQAQKMEAVGQLAGGIAHDFNNLLTVITGRSELALARLPPGDALRREIELISTTAERAADLTRQLLAFSRKQMIQLRVVDLNAVVGGMASMLTRLIGETIELVTVPGPALGRVKADPGQIEQVIMNLAVNARDAMPGGGRLTIQTANRELDAASAARLDARPGPCVMLAVTDTGIGMDAETRARIFEPFFTTKDVGKGTGLGLSTVDGIVSQHGGCLDVGSEPGRGTTFRMYLPRLDDTQAAAPSPKREEAPRGQETILLVEDDDAVRDLAREVLAGLGYTVLHASRPGEALAAAERHSGTIHLLLTDVVMPEMSGRALAHHLLRLRPGMGVLFMSGYTDTALGQHGILDAGTVLLHKPFTPVALARKVRAVLDAPPGRPDAFTS